QVPVVDVVAIDVHRGRRVVGHGAAGQVQLVGPVEQALDEVAAVVFDRPREGVDVLLHRPAAGVVDGDVRLRLDEPHAYPQDVPESAVGVGQPVEQVGLAFGAGGDDLAGAEQHVGLDDAVVDEAVAKSGGLYADPHHRAAHGNVLEFRRHGGQEAGGEGVAHQGLEGGQALGLDGAAFAVEVDDLVERRQVHRLAPAAVAAAVAEQVRRGGLPDAPEAAVSCQRGLELGEFVPVG